MVPGARNKLGGPASKCTVLKKVLATLLGLFGAPNISLPRPLCPFRCAPAQNNFSSVQMGNLWMYGFRFNFFHSKTSLRMFEKQSQQDSTTEFFELTTPLAKWQVFRDVVLLKYSNHKETAKSIKFETVLELFYTCKLRRSTYNCSKSGIFLLKLLFHKNFVLWHQILISPPTSPWESSCRLLA